MARRPRLEAPGHSHLVWQPLVAGRSLVADDADLMRWCDALREVGALERVAIQAWAISADSAWLLLAPEQAGSLGRFMQGLGRRCVAALNRRHGLAGPLWAGRFRAAIVEPGGWRLAATQWVDGQAARLEWGSAAPRAGLARRPAWLADPPELWTLGNTPFERESLWRLRLDQPLPPFQAEILARAATGNWVAGSAAFAHGLAESLGRATRPRMRGRPALTTTPR